MNHPLNSVVWCKLAASPIHGIGVFAIRDIPRGTTLASGEITYDLDGEILPEILSVIQDHHALLEFSPVVPNPNYDAFFQCFMNHSDTPNSDGLAALRDIARGEEITEDYTKTERPLGPKARAHFTFL